MSHPSRCLRFSASLPAIAAMVTTALPPVAAAAAASLLFVSGNHARAADPWSEWQPLPDHRQTAVDLHYRSVTIKGKPSLVYQLRNRYGRAVTVKLQITGAAEDGLEIEEQIIALKANGKSGKPDESREIVSSSLRTVTRVAVLALEFREEDGPPPDAGIAGAGSRSAETQRLTTEIARARRAAERADRDANEADRAYATMRFSVDAFRNGIYNPQTGLRYRIGPNDVMQAQSRAEAARNKMRQAHDQLDGLKKRLALSQGEAASEVSLATRASEFATKGEWVKAEEAYRNALNQPAVFDFAPEDKAALNANFAISLQKQNKHEEAEMYFRRAAELSPQNASLQARYGDALLTSGKTGEAETAFREAARLKPTEPSYHHNLGMALWQQNRYSDAEIAYRQAAKLDPVNAETQNALGAALAQQEKLPEAAVAFREAVRLLPTKAVYRRSLGITCTQMKTWTEAEASLREALRLAPGDAYEQDCLGVALFSQNKFPGALAAFQEAVRLEPGNPDYQAHLRAARSRS